MSVAAALGSRMQTLAAAKRSGDYGQRHGFPTSPHGGGARGIEDTCRLFLENKPRLARFRLRIANVARSRS